MQNKTFIGLDFGSDSVRALLVDQNGSILDSAVHNYPRWAEQRFCDASTGQFRQHPLDYIESMSIVLEAVLKNNDPSRVAAIGVDTTASTPCAVDESGQPLALTAEFADDPDAMFILWKDHTALEAERAINQAAADYANIDYRKYSGESYSCEWFWSKLLHVLRHNPAIRQKAYSFVEHCDWITHLLTGNTDPRCMKRGRCAAGHKAMWHADWGGLPPEDFLVSIDPLLGGWRSRLYEQTFTADQAVGTLDLYWQQKFGLSGEVVISGGVIDCHAGAVGAQIAPGEMVKVLGTSTCDILVSQAPVKCITGICGQVDGSVLPGMIGFEAGQASFGDVYNWFKNFLGYAGNVTIGQLEADAAALEFGPANRVVALDWFNGRRTPFANTSLKGMIGNLDLAATPPAVYRALVESTVMGSKAILEHFLQAGLPVNGITAVGGISNKSPYIMQMCADAFNIPLKVASAPQACALGSAMIAAAASGIYPTVESAAEAMGSGYSAIYRPRPELKQKYEAVFAQYCKLGRSWEDFSCSL